MPSILYVDDNSDNLEILKIAFEDVHNVTTCDCPVQGLKEVKKNSYDAIILDVHMPKMNGFELYQSIKNLNGYEKKPIFFISSDLKSEIKVEGLSLGSDDFLSREMEPGEIIARVENKLIKANSNKPSNFKFYDLELDPANLIVKLSNEILELTSIEYRMLLSLMSSTKNFLSREDLISKVWPNNSKNIVSQTLNTHLSNLRKKLSTSKILVKSVRSYGISLVYKD